MVTQEQLDVAKRLTKAGAPAEYVKTVVGIVGQKDYQASSSKKKSKKSSSASSTESQITVTPEAPTKTTEIVNVNATTGMKTQVTTDVKTGAKTISYLDSLNRIVGQQSATKDNVVQQNGYSYKLNPVTGSFETVSRPSAQQEKLNKVIDVNVRVNRGDAVKAEELTYGAKTIELFSPEVKSQTYAAEYQKYASAKRAQQIAEQKSPVFLKNFEIKPTQQEALKSELTSRGLLVAQKPTAVARPSLNASGQAFVKRAEFANKAFSSLSSVPKSGMAIYGAASQAASKPVFAAGSFVIKTGKAYAANVESQIGSYEKEVTSVDLLGNPTKVTRTIYGLNKPDSLRVDASVVAAFKNYKEGVKSTAFYKPAMSAVDVSTSAAENFGAKLETSKNPILKYSGIGIVGVTAVAQPWLKQTVEDPLGTYVSVVAPLKIGKALLGAKWGTRAYGALDVADVAGSVVTEGVKGYAKGGIIGGVVGAGSGFIGEKVSDYSAGWTAGTPKFVSLSLSNSMAGTPATRGKQLSYLPTDLTPAVPVIRSKGAPTLIVTQGATPGTFTTQYKYEPKIISGIQTKGDDITTTYQKFKINLPTTDDDASVLFETTPIPKTRKRITEQYVKVNRGFGQLKRSKRASFAGTMGQGSDSFTGAISNENFAGTLPTAGFQSTVVSNVPSISQTLSQTPAKVKTYQSSQLTSQFTAKSMFAPTTKAFATFGGKGKTAPASQFTFKAGVGTISNTIAPSFLQSLTETPTQTKAISETASLSRTITGTVSQTMTFTKTPTITRSPTKTPTITLTPTKVKFPKSALGLKSSSFKPFKGSVSTKYSPTAFAAGFGLKGGRKTGKFTGLEFRGL